MNVYAYIRVSTHKQGELGVSLREQRDAIVTYAQKHGLHITQWFEEHVTASKKGRRQFSKMLAGLKRGHARGVIIHKVDRSVRNLRDWVDIGDLIDSGISVHFSNENIDLNSRSGRLTGDMLAVVATNFSRNNKEEAEKGVLGRLKEGLYPNAAPIGYLDMGKGKVKEIDSIKGPLVRMAYELYDTGCYTLETLAEELYRRGLRNRLGRRLCINSLSLILNNPFYAGLIRIKKTGITYAGAHTPIISMALFKRVQARLAGKLRHQGIIHEFTFRGLFRCALCGRALLGEVQKGHRYYRCHARGCPSKTFREEVLEAAILNVFPALELSDDHRATILRELDVVMRDDQDATHQRQAHLRAQLGALQTRQAKLVDALLDGLIDKPMFELRKGALLEEERLLRDSLDSPKDDRTAIKTFVEAALELASTAQQSYKIADAASRRELALKVCSNFSVSGKEVSVEPSFRLDEVLNDNPFLRGAPHQDASRTAERLWEWGKGELHKNNNNDTATRAPDTSASVSATPPCTARSLLRPCASSDDELAARLTTHSVAPIRWWHLTV